MNFLKTKVSLEAYSVSLLIAFMSGFLLYHSLKLKTYQTYTSYIESRAASCILSSFDIDGMITPEHRKPGGVYLLNVPVNRDSGAWKIFRGNK